MEVAIYERVKHLRWSHVLSIRRGVNWNENKVIDEMWNLQEKLKWKGAINEGLNVTLIGP